MVRPLCKSSAHWPGLHQLQQQMRQISGHMTLQEDFTAGTTDAKPLSSSWKVLVTFMLNATPVVCQPLRMHPELLDTQTNGPENA